MSNKIKYSFIIILTFLFLSCKKIEKKFPAGFYQFQAEVEEKNKEGETIKERFPIFTAELLESSENELELSYFVVNLWGDTLKDVIIGNGSLNVSNEDSIYGVLPARLIGDRPIIFSNGRIVKNGRNQFSIIGDIDYEIWSVGIDGYFWKKFTGTYVFSKVE